MADGQTPLNSLPEHLKGHLQHLRDQPQFWELLRHCRALRSKPLGRTVEEAAINGSYNTALKEFEQLWTED